MTTVLEIIDGGTRYLEKRGVEDARRNMQMLVAHALGWTRMELYLKFDDAVADEKLGALREALKKRGEGVPLQHLLGTVWFHNREFKTDGRGLIPRPETEELVEKFLKIPLPENARVLDMGCGSGVLGLTIAAELSGARVVLADVSGDALALAGENAELLGVTNVEFVSSDLFSAITRDFHGIVANLPYVPEIDRNTLAREVMHDPALALFGGNDGLDVIRRFVSAAREFLADGGVVAMEVGHDQGQATADLLAAAGFAAVRVENDMSGVARFPIARM
ncbi:MAG: peptide chain release factor N(5)-glutamine methyltransferase [Verrucomicrobiota bacterium]